MEKGEKLVYFVRNNVDDYKYTMDIYAKSYTPLKETNSITNRHRYTKEFNVNDYMGKAIPPNVTSQFTIEFLEEDLINVRDVFEQVTGEDISVLYSKWDEKKDVEYIKKFFVTSSALFCEGISKFRDIDRCFEIEEEKVFHEYRNKFGSYNVFRF